MGNDGDMYGEYRADFLWPHEKGSVEQAGYEFANAITEEYRQQWWEILLEKAREGWKNLNMGVHDVGEFYKPDGEEEQ